MWLFNLKHNKVGENDRRKCSFGPFGFKYVFSQLSLSAVIQSYIFHHDEVGPTLKLNLKPLVYKTPRKIMHITYYNSSNIMVLLGEQLILIHSGMQLHNK